MVEQGRAGFVAAFALLAAGVAMAGEEMVIHTDANVVTVKAGDKELLRYRYGDVAYKPYVDRFLTPGGINVVRDSPSDHKHHHGLMFAVKVDDVNFWEEQGAPGRQQHRAFSDTPGDEAAAFTERLDWVGPEGQAVLLKEERTIRVIQTDDPGVSLLSWQSRFELPPGKEAATLTGAHYHGLGMRFLESMDAGGQFRNARDGAGKVVRGDERLTPAAWCAYTAEADGRPVTVAMFGHPDNPRGPTLWFTMSTPFAYLAATLNLWKEPLELAPGTPLVLRYGVALWDGAADNARIEAVYRKWLLTVPGD